MRLDHVVDGTCKPAAGPGDGSLVHTDIDSATKSYLNRTRMQKSRALRALRDAVKDGEFLERLRQQNAQAGITDDALVVSSHQRASSSGFRKSSSPLPYTPWAEEQGLRRSLLPPQEGGLGDEIANAGPSEYPPSRGRSKVSSCKMITNMPP